jgi:2-dehydropantoate 2-reductase
MAACLAHVGEAVTLVVRPEKAPAYPAKIKYESTLGNWEADVKVSGSVPGTDVLWLTMKATHLDSALKSIPSDAQIGAVVPLLNGIDHVELLRAKFGAERVIPATIAGEMERIAPGHFVHPSPFLMLNLSGRGRELLGTVVDRLRGLGVTCNFVDDETTLMWTKMAFLAPLALTTSAFDRTVGEVMANPETCRQLEACVRETCAAGVTEGAKLDADGVIAMMKKAPPGMRSSMQKDVDAGRPPELDAIGGPILRASARHGLKAPVTKALMTQIEERQTAPRQAS